MRILVMDEHYQNVHGVKLQKGKEYPEGDPAFRGGGEEYLAANGYAHWKSTPARAAVEHSEASESPPGEAESGGELNSTDDLSRPPIVKPAPKPRS